MRLFFILLALTGLGSLALQSADPPSLAPTRHIVQTVVAAPKAAAAAVGTPKVEADAPTAQPAVATPDYVAEYGADHVAIMTAAGIAPSDYYYVNYILNHESGWCPTKSEGEIGVGCPAYHGYTSDGYGMCQSTPADKMAVMGAGWETSPVLQLEWCTQHAAGYGGWYASYVHWTNYHNW